jgi:hypothetical protein
MTDLFRDNHARAGENLQTVPAIPAIDEANGTGRALPAGLSTLPTTESADALPTPESLPNSSDTTASPLGDNAEFGRLGKVVGANAVSSEGLGAGTPPPSPTRTDSEIGELHTHIKQMIAGRTRLPDSISSLVAFWAISIWFQEAFPIFPALVITGPAHEAMVVLGVLGDLCLTPTLLAGFKRADLRELNGYRTLLIAESNLNNRTAALLGNLTNRNFVLVEQGYYLHCAGSRAIYVGEDPSIKRIQHSLYIDATIPPGIPPPAPGQALSATIASLRNRILLYRKRNLSKVRFLAFHPRGLSLESHAIANALGSCLVDSPQLQMELVGLLRPQHHQQIADRADSVEALVASASLALCHQGKDQVYVKEIAAEVNRLLVARGETMQFSPEKVGRKLKKVGLFTRRLSPAGNGLALDQATRIRLHEVARAWRGEDSIADTKNLHCPLCSQNESLREVG